MLLRGPPDPRGVPDRRWRVARRRRRALLQPWRRDRRLRTRPPASAARPAGDHRRLSQKAPAASTSCTPSSVESRLVTQAAPGCYVDLLQFSPIGVSMPRLEWRRRCAVEDLDVLEVRVNEPSTRVFQRRESRSSMHPRPERLHHRVVAAATTCLRPARGHPFSDPRSNLDAARVERWFVMRAVELVFAVGWVVFWLYWVVAAFSMKRVVSRGRVSCGSEW